MEISTDLTAIIKIQQLAKQEIINGDLTSAKVLLEKAKEMLLILNNEQSQDKTQVAAS